MVYAGNERIARRVLRAEVAGEVGKALKLLAPGYTMTWVYLGRRGKLFPRTTADVPGELEEVYPIRGRRYDLKHLATGRGVVMVELVESYPDPKTKRVYRTPLVLVLEMSKGRIKRGRHYCDPRVSHLHLTKRQVAQAFR